MRRTMGWAAAAHIFMAIVAMCCWAPEVFADLTAHDYSVELVATVAEAPPEITLNWLPDANAAHYSISRKLLGEQAWNLMMTLRGSETSWTDANVVAGTAYEYQVIKATNLGYTGYGYICAAIRRAPVENRGTMILLVEKDLGAALETELDRLEQDLVGDGWSVVRRDISKTVSPPEVKAVVRDLYQADPVNRKALFLFGHIPIPFSGDIDPDMHEDDLGAWPADVYYADMDGQWTDSTVNRTNTYNMNVPGDGKFDQSVPPGTVRLQMGRVDLSNLTCFANKTPARYEVDLARQYLNKDHNFRHGQIDVERRAMIFDRMYRGLELEPQTCAAWRSFPGFFGRDQLRVIGQDEYFPILSTNSYLWSYVVSGGSIYGCDFIGTSDSWALSEPKVVFTSFLGSWFGQWDRESDFLRAPLGTSGYTLAAIFSGQPQWILHPMGMGEPIGLAALLTQNNNTNGLYPPQINAGVAEVHIDLMGDPSLRMLPVKPPGSVSGAIDSTGVALSWNASSDPAVIGYYIYKSDSAGGPFTRISGMDPVTSVSFKDSAGTSADYYMVRALKLEQTAGGSYYNLSQGMFYPDASAQTGIPEAPRSLAVSAITPGAVDVSWISSSPSVRGFELQRRALPDGAFTTVAETDSGTTSYNDTSLSAGTYAYRVKALGFAGDSNFSGEAFLNLQPAWSVLVGTDTATGGDWIGKYGDSGYLLIAGATNLPGYVTIGTSNVSTYVSSWNTTSDATTLLRPDGKSRFLAQWLNGFWKPMVVSLRFSDSATHRVSLYMVDKDNTRSGKLDLVDPFTGNIFATQDLPNYFTGEYVTFDVRNYVDLRFTSYETFNSMLVSGIFFSEAPPSTSSATISYVGDDLSTRGDWPAKYGSAGEIIPAWNSTFPAEVRVDLTKGGVWTWNTSASEPQALSKNNGDSTRLATTWYDADQLQFNVTSSTTARQLALYFLDWDKAGRVEDLTIADMTGAPLLTRRIQNFANGEYVIFNARGSFQINVRHVTGPNAVLSGFFLDAAVQQIATTPAQLGAPTLAGGGYAIRVNGQSGQVFEIQSSDNLQSWNAIDRVSLSTTSADYSIPFAPETHSKFFRAVLSQ